jgi:hypothetical protein
MWKFVYNPPLDFRILNKTNDILPPLIACSDVPPMAPTIICKGNIHA